MFGFGGGGVLFKVGIVCTQPEGLKSVYFHIQVDYKGKDFPDEKAFSS